MKIKRYVWLFVVWLLWHISEALRKDYTTYLERSWKEGMTGRDFNGWLSVRIFGDEGGYDDRRQQPIPNA